MSNGAWCCDGCAERLSLDLSGAASFFGLGWCGVGQHQVRGYLHWHDGPVVSAPASLTHDPVSVGAAPAVPSQPQPAPMQADLFG